MAAVFVVGVSGTYFGMQEIGDNNALVKSSSVHMVGHVTAIMYGPDGEIKAYRQSDNEIVEHGMGMIAAQVFEGINTTGVDLPTALTARVGGLSSVDSIGIGTGTNPVSSQDDTITFNGCNNVTTSGPVGPINFGTPFNSPNNNRWSLQTDNATRNGPTSETGFAAVGINGSATFGPHGSCVGAYVEAGAFDNNTSGAMFARNTYTLVTLTAVDSLVINWNFQFDDS